MRRIPLYIIRASSARVDSSADGNTFANSFVPFPAGSGKSTQVERRERKRERERKRDKEPDRSIIFSQRLKILKFSIQRNQTKTNVIQIFPLFFSSLFFCLICFSSVSGDVAGVGTSGCRANRRRQKRTLEERTRKRLR